MRGTAALALRSVPALVNAAGFLAVARSPDGLVLADPGVASTEGALFGVLTRPARVGTEGLVAVAGAVVRYPLWTWTPTAPLYVVAGGGLSETPPGTGWVRVAARALSATSILVTLEPGGLAPAAAGIPAGGSTGQVLAKTSGADYAVAWATPSGGGGGSPNLDGGTAASVYGGVDPIDGGGA